ncbi:MAG TPA: folate-binding protein [Gammaproteobacteria bacterium]
MNSTWQTFLTAQGARYDGDRLAGFATDSPAMSADILADLSHEGIIAVQGADARAFLQGQLSTDIDALTPDTSQLSSWSTAKGRVVTVLRVLQYQERILLLLPRPLLTAVMKRLSMYVLRAKASLSDASDAWVRIGLAGNNAIRLLEIAGLPVPRKVNAAITHGDLLIVRLHGATPRFLILGPTVEMTDTWKRLVSAGAVAAGEDSWALHKILAHEATVYPETTEHFVAQMIGLEELGAVNFKKGCYIGQEIIARAHFRGTVKRHLLQARCDTKDIIPPGAAIRIAGNTVPVAEVVDARPGMGSGQEMLIVIQDEHRDGALQLTTNGRPVSIVQAV